VMEEGPDTRVLARVEHYELVGPAWMAAVFKFPRENLQLRKRAQILKRHNAAPKPGRQPSAPDPNLLDWDVNLIIGAANKFQGTVMARDQQSAIEAAIERFRLKHWQIKRLIVTVRTR
jgi:hypothetical protein